MKIIIAAMIAILALGCAAPASPESPAAPARTEAIIPDTGSSDTMPAPVKTFIVTGRDFRFEMDGIESPDLHVTVGDRVRIEFTSIQGFHDWVVDEFGAATEQVTSGGTTIVEFIADKPGTFEYYCSVGSHRQNGMVGNLIVSQ